MRAGEAHEQRAERGGRIGWVNRTRPREKCRRQPGRHPTPQRFGVAPGVLGGNVAILRRQARKGYSAFFHQRADGRGYERRPALTSNRQLIEREITEAPQQIMYPIDRAGMATRVDALQLIFDRCQSPRLNKFA